MKATIKTMKNKSTKTNEVNKDHKKGFKPNLTVMLDKKAPAWQEMEKKLPFKLSDIIVEGETKLLEHTIENDFITERVKEFEKFHRDKPFLKRIFANASVYFGFYRFPDIRLRRLAVIAFTVKTVLEYDSIAKKISKFYNIPSNSLTQYLVEDLAEEMELMIGYIRKTIPKYKTLIITDNFNKMTLVEQYKVAGIIDGCLIEIAKYDAKINPSYYPTPKKSFNKSFKKPATKKFNNKPAGSFNKSKSTGFNKSGGFKNKTTSSNSKPKSTFNKGGKPKFSKW